MFSVFDKFVFYTFLNIFIGINGLVELPKFEVTDLITTEEVIRNCTNSVLSSLKLAKPVNFTRIRDYATTLHYFLSLTFRDSEVLNEIARLTRVDKGNNKTEGNLTTILNELLDENSCDFKANDVGIDDSDASVVIYINSFLAKLEELKENFGVNKVFADINSNIIKIFRSANESYSEKDGFVNSINDTAENFNVFDNGEFWQESGRRIFKGKRTKIKYFPFMASVHIFNTFQCAGSIIKSDVVITASSCLQLAWNNRLYRENPAFLSVRVGSSFYTSGGDSIPVLEIYFHPEYNPKNLRNNISLMRLLRHIKFRYTDKRKVRKIAIDKQASNMPINIPGITILGWGAKGLGNRLGNPWNNILSYAILDVYPLRECQEVYTKEYVTNKNFCGGFFSKGGGACNIKSFHTNQMQQMDTKFQNLDEQIKKLRTEVIELKVKRDVGAPGVVDGLLMGVVSFGSPVCGTPDVPTVFTKLGYYYHWIKNIMDMEIPRGKKGTTLQILDNPFAAYMTTPYTTTTFKIEPLGPHSKPKSALEEDEESFLRNLDGNLFQDFLRTMFGDDETQKYQYLIDQMKKKQLVEEMKKHYKDIKEISRQTEIDAIKDNEVSEQSQISKPAVDKEQSIEVPYQPLTSGYDSENYLYPSTVQDYKSDNDAPSTALIFTDNGKVADDDYPVTENTRGQQQSRYETNFIPITQHGKDIARNDIISHAPTLTTKVEQSTSLTTKLAEQIELELAMESSDESDDSDQLLSDDKDNLTPIKGEVKVFQSAEISDIPGEEALTKLLDDIDLDQIIKEVSTDTKQTHLESNQMPKSERHGNLFIPVPTSLAPVERKVKDKVENYNNIGRQGNDFDESVLTLLYLSDTEKKNNLHVDSRNFGDHTKNNIVQSSTPQELSPSESIYKIIPKSNVYKIISEILRTAIENKKKFE